MRCGAWDVMWEAFDGCSRLRMCCGCAVRVTVRKWEARRRLAMCCEICRGRVGMCCEGARACFIRQSPVACGEQAVGGWRCALGP